VAKSKNMRQWRLIESGAGSAQWNMAVDEALLRSFRQNDLPVFRLYDWERPALSFGRFSNPLETLDWDKVQADNISTVRRMTGGGILVHGGDLSYSLIVPHTFIAERGVKESYRALCLFLLQLYKKLGLDASFACDNDIVPEHTPVCLAGKEAYDIVIGGRKTGGNAQRHSSSAMLQHGSVPLVLDRERFEPIFQGESGLGEGASLAETGVDMEILRNMMIESFAETFGAALRRDTMSDDEYSLAKKLYKNKYTKESWNVHGKSPAT